ncbi:hypothetical protein [Streptomyces carpaticus]|uniref:Uncharacterized protein n=1 Tax=Streptomyces carpaticus TaxID=285558 RepID=A0ABV4ZVR9_9ACTN
MIGLGNSQPVTYRGHRKPLAHQLREIRLTIAHALGELVEEGIDDSGERGMETLDGLPVEKISQRPPLPGMSRWIEPLKSLSEFP